MTSDQALSPVVRAAVSDRPLDVTEHADAVAHHAAGAVVSFAGVVRDHDHGRPVSSLEYSGHPSADRAIGEIVAEVLAEAAAEGLVARGVAVSHRIGALRIGDVAFAVAVSADHRGPAFQLCSRLVDEVKARLPVWKHQRFADGTDEWVACP